jgi:hypothetical protein
VVTVRARCLLEYVVEEEQSAGQTLHWPYEKLD